MSTQLSLTHPEGTGEMISHSCAPPSTGRTPAVPGEPLTFPADRETTDLWAENFRRRGVECEVVPNGRKWVVVG